MSNVYLSMAGHHSKDTVQYKLDSIQPLLCTLVTMILRDYTASPIDSW